MEQTSSQLTESQKKFRTILVVTAFILFSIFALGMFFTVVSNLEKSAILTLSFVAGLSMIFLPCTLPLVFIVVPLALSGNPKKGFIIALLFGLGLSITLSIYGIAIALLGGWLGLTTATEYMFMIGGVAAFIFGLAELKFINLKIPGYGGKLPDFIQTQGDYFKSFLLGLFLGNAGVGCPNPAFYILLGYIATTGNPIEGWYLGFIHGVGRAVPLIFLAILAILGVSATSWVTKQKEKVESFIGWALVYIGIFIFMNGAFTHEWYVQSGIHTVWERLLEKSLNILGSLFGLKGLAGKFGELVEHHHEVISSPFNRLGNWVMVALFSLPLAWNWFKNKKTVRSAIIYIALIILFIFMFVMYLPSTVLSPKHEEKIIRVSGGYARTIDLHNYLARIELSSERPAAGAPFSLGFVVLNKATNKSITNLEIVHEKPMHVIFAREDLANFVHLHPELSGESYVLNHTFAEEGYYKGWADFTYKGETHIFDFLIDTKNAKKTSLVPDFSREKIFNGYKVVMNNETKEFHFTITKDGQDVQLSQLLGAAGHLVAISEDLSDFIHTHAEGMMDHHGRLFINQAQAHGGEETTTDKNELHFSIPFAKSGVYKLWMQTMVDNQVLTADFMVEAK